MSVKIGRRAYAEHYGPTTGDRVRLADTALWVQVRKTSRIMAKKSNLAAAKSFAMAWDSPKKGLPLRLTR